MGSNAPLFTGADDRTGAGSVVGVLIGGRTFHLMLNGTDDAASVLKQLGISPTLRHLPDESNRTEGLLGNADGARFVLRRIDSDVPPIPFTGLAGEALPPASLEVVDLTGQSIDLSGVTI